MLRVKYSSIILFGALALHSLISKLIFDKINLTSNIVVDEEFHLQLGEAYCKYEFDKWHPKVTTFPGLYLLSSLLLGAFNLCSTYWLRFTSLLFSFINIILFYCLFNTNNENPRWQNVISAINLSILPPLYFFSHLYYTDVASLTMILLLFLLSQRGHHYLASIFGMFAVLFRQTNIIWVGMVFACYVLKELNTVYQKKPRKGSSRGDSAKELIQLLKIFQGDLWITLKRTTLQFWLNAASYTSLLLFFVLFVYLNGSIVVGDKSAHEATIHFPQLFYFSLFSIFFAWPYFASEVLNFLKFARTYRVFVLCVLVTSLVIIHFNTLVHPYLLADNRHYVFYIWNRFYGKHFSFRYLVVPVYLFSWFVIIKKLWDKSNVTFLLLYIPCTFVVLTTQKLLELRYFFIPYVLFRLHIKNTSSVALLYEFFSHFLINILTLYLFFTKTIQWEDYDYPQRLIW
jgi:alpha-1,2-glucosyltransferase